MCFTEYHGEGMEDTRGNALQRTLKILRDLMQGKEHDRHSAATTAGIKPAAADRQLKAMEKTIPEVVSKVGKDRRRIFRFDRASTRRDHRASKQAIVAACFGASLGKLFDGNYKVAMQEALSDQMARHDRKIASVDRKFWFVRQGGEFSLPTNQHLLDELIDALLEQNHCEIEYEHFDGRVERIRILPLSAVIHEHQLYFMARNEKSQIRSYRFSRIRIANRQDEKFEYPSQAEYDPEQLFRESFGIFIGDDYPVKKVRLWLAERWRAFAQTHRWHPSQQVSTALGTPRKNGIELSLRIRVCPEFERWVLSFGEDAEVLAPKSLRSKIAERSRLAASTYKAPKEPARANKATHVKTKEPVSAPKKQRKKA